MIRAFLMATVLALPAAGALAQADRPLVEWNTQDWNPESQAACGAFLTKFGILVSIKQQTDDVFQILWRGIAINMLSEVTDPETNKLAWAAPIDMGAGDGKTLFMSCGDLANQALEDNLIPQSILDEAAEEANETMME